MGLPTAEEARAMDPTKELETWLDKIGHQITEAAKTGKTETRFPYALTEIVGEGDAHPKDGVATLIAKTLIENGYTLEPIWDCGGQFVDAYILIKWGGK